MQPGAVPFQTRHPGDIAPPPANLCCMCTPIRNSQWNEGEAKVVMEHVQRLMAAGISPSDIGIITPYNAQVGVALRGMWVRLQSSRPTTHRWVGHCLGIRMRLHGPPRTDGGSWVERKLGQLSLREHMS